MHQRTIDETEVRIATADGLPYEVASLHGREEISRLFDFTLHLVTKHGVAIDSDALVGSAATIVFVKRDEVVRQIPGIIASVDDMLDTETVGGAIRVRVVPRLWLWTLRETSEVFVEASVPEVVQTKLEQLGLVSEKDFQLRLMHRYSKRELIIQYKESDLQFVSRLLEHLGLSFYFEEQDGRDVVIITDNPSGFSGHGGPLEIPFRRRGERKDVHELKSSARVIPNHYVVRDYNYRTPQVELLADVTLPVGASADVIEYGGHFKTPQDGKFLATVRAEERLAGRKVYDGKSDLPGICAGGFFELVDHPRGTLRLFVTAVEHAVKQPVATVAESEVAPYQSSFQAIPAGIPFRPARVTPKPRVHGVITGVIDAEQNSQYAVLDAHGRYQVRFLFDEGATEAGRGSHPVRMAQPHTGPGYGMHFPLRPGVEVMLTCVDGDPDRPIIAGTVPNAQTTSPVHGSNAPRNIIRTGGGNEINIDDTEGSHRIKLSTPYRNTTFQLGAPNDAEAGAILSTVGASTTAATSGVSTITSFNSAFNGFWKWSTAGNVSLAAKKPDAMAVAAMAMSVLDGVTTLASNALTLHTNLRKQHSAALAQAQSARDVDTARKKAALDRLHADQTDPQSPNSVAALLAQYKATKNPKPAASVTVTKQAPPPPPPATGQPTPPAKAVLAASGTPTTSSVVSITITAGAPNLAAGTARLTYTLDFEGAPNAVTIPVSGVVTIPNLGVTLTFADGAFNVGDTYEVTCVADYIAAYQTAQSSIAKDLKTRDTDRDALYLLERQNADSSQLAGQLGDSIAAARLTLWLDHRQVAIDQRNLHALRTQIEKDLADAKAASPQDAALIALLERLAKPIADYDGALADYAAAVDASSAARRELADDAYDMANSPDEINIARTQQAIAMEKGLTALISLAMGIYGTVSSFTAKYKANSAWGKLGTSLKAGKPRFPTRPDGAFTYNALRSPVASVSGEHSAQVSSDRKLLLTSAMIGVYASRPKPPDPPNPLDPAAVAAAAAQAASDAALVAGAAAAATAAETAAKAADKAVKDADKAWNEYTETKLGLLRLDKWAKWAALNTAARAQVKAAEVAADAAAKANALSETGILAVGADDHLSLTSKRLLELASGEMAYLTAETGVDVKVTNGAFTLEAKNGNSKLTSLEGALVLSAGPDPAAGAGDPASQLLLGTSVGNISFASHAGDVTLDAKKGTVSLLSLDGAKTAKVEAKSADEKVSITASKHIVLDAGLTGDIRLSAGGFSVRLSSAGIVLTKDGPAPGPNQPAPASFSGPAVSISSDEIVVKSSTANVVKLTGGEIVIKVGPASSVTVAQGGVDLKGRKISGA